MNIKSKLVYIYNLLRGFYWMNIVKYIPQVHAEYEMKRQHQSKLLRKVNIKEPFYFQEKMLWLKYFLYNNSPIVAKCYNKYLVREYVESKGLSNILNKLYFKADNINTIPWDNLPEECVIKLSNGYAGHVFKRKGETFSVKKAIKILSATKKRSNYGGKVSGDLFADKTKAVYICEKLIKADTPDALPSDYKIHCFNGQPMFLEYIHDRDYNNKNKFYKGAFIDINKNIDRYDLEGECSPISDIKYPVSFDLMIKYAKILSQDFPYVRVDFYEEDGKPIFGELTFTPYHSQTSSSQLELGDLIDLHNINKYKEILKVK